MSEGLGSASASVVQATRVHESHGARDSQRLFQRFGLKLNIPVSELKVEGSSEKQPFLKISTFISYMLRKHPQLLFGGHSVGAEAEHLCESFWTHYREGHPEHALFQKYPKEQWRYIIPIAVHGDKGRSYKKSPIFVFSHEVPFGLPESLRARGSKLDTARQRQRIYKQEHGGNLNWSCSQRARSQLFPEDVPEESCPKHQQLQDGVPHNGRGNTFLSRFLITAIPNRMLKEHPQVVACLLKEMAADLTGLFEDGIAYDEHHTFRVVLIGVKGDFEFHLEVAQYNRSYANIGTRNSLAYCPECNVGMAGVEGMDFRDVPTWHGTLYQSEPWDMTPILNAVPFDAVSPARLYRKDPFHMLKFGVFKDMCASTVMYLGQLGYWDTDAQESKALDARLARAYSYFRLWCVANSKCTTLKKFSRGNFHRQKATSFPFLGGKGSDSVLLCSFLEFYLQLKLPQLIDESHRPILLAMLEAIQGALAFVGTMHSHNIFLSPPCARFLALSGLRFIKGYAWLADRCISEKRRFYAVRPRLHFFQHTILELQIQLDKGDTHIISPSIWNCEANEDFIGRVSRISRGVSPRLASLRTIQNYLVSCKLLFRRAGL